jgi:hypothetical protein
MARPSPDRATTDDKLNFHSYVLPITRTIRDAARADQLPLTIGIFGRWGTGKTSLMKMVEQELGPTPEEISNTDKRKQASQRALRWLVPILILWLLLILAGLLLILVAARWIQAYTGLENVKAQALWASMMAGALGGLVAASFTVWARGFVEQDLDPLVIPWLVLRPLTGILAGLIVFLLLWGGTRLVSASANLNIAVYFTLAFLVGLTEQPYAALWRAFKAWDESRRKRMEELAKRAPDQKAAAQQAEGRPEARGDFQVIWFNAWKFAKEDELWAALLQEALRQIKVKAVGGERLRIKWQLWKDSIDWHSGFRDVALKLLPTAGKTLLAAGFAYLGGLVAAWAVGSRYGEQIGQTAGAVGAVLTGLLPVAAWLRTNLTAPLADLDFDKYRKKASYKDHLSFLTEFSTQFRNIMRTARGKGNPLVLILDDLDRCLPEQAVSVLEAIKLFVSDDAPVVFLIGADQEVIERAIEVKYDKMVTRADTDPLRRERFARFGREYLEKIVQLSFHLPPIEEGLIDQFIDDVFRDNTWVVDHSHIFAAGLQPNPRQVLRVLNIYNFMIELAQEKKWLYAKIIQPDVLAKAVVVQYRWPELWRQLETHPDLLGVLEKSMLEATPPDDPEMAGLVEAYAGEDDLRSLLTVKEGGSLAGVDLRHYIYLSESVQIRPGKAEKPPLPPKKAPPRRVRRKLTTEEALAAESLNAALQKATLALDEAARQRPAWVQMGISPRRIATYENRLKRALTDQDAQAAEAAQGEFQKVLATAEAGRIDRIRQRHADLREQYKKLGEQGADSALLVLIDERLKRAEKAIETNDLAAAGVHLDDASSLVENAQADLKARQVKEAGRVIEARIASDGRLFLQRAVTYEPIEVMLDAPGPLKPGKIFVYSGREPIIDELSTMNMRLWDIRTRLGQDAYSPEERRELGEQLGERLRPVLRLLREAPRAAPYRLRLTANSTKVDDLPWEMAVLDPASGLPLGLDSRYALVRGHPSQTDRPALDLGKLPPKMLVLSTESADPYQLALLRRIEFRFDVRFLTGSSSKPDEFNAAFQKESPTILHLIPGKPDASYQKDPYSQEPYFDIKLDLELIRNHSGLVVFSMADGQYHARSVFGGNVPAALTWQLGINEAAAEAFYYPFYNALLRSGQPEFAVTEGRRAIAAALGNDSPLAVSPMLYLSGSAEPA